MKINAGQLAFANLEGPARFWAGYDQTQISIAINMPRHTPLQDGLSAAIEELKRGHPLN